MPAPPPDVAAHTERVLRDMHARIARRWTDRNGDAAGRKPESESAAKRHLFDARKRALEPVLDQAAGDGSPGLFFLVLSGVDRHIESAHRARAGLPSGEHALDAWLAEPRTQAQVLGLLEDALKHARAEAERSPPAVAPQHR